MTEAPSGPWHGRRRALPKIIRTVHITIARVMQSPLLSCPPAHGIFQPLRGLPPCRSPAAAESLLAPATMAAVPVAQIGGLLVFVDASGVRRRCNPGTSWWPHHLAPMNCRAWEQRAQPQASRAGTVFVLGPRHDRRPLRMFTRGLGRARRQARPPGFDGRMDLFMASVRPAPMCAMKQ